MPPASSPAPRSFVLRTYQVGFGDCFLLTFHYEDFDRHILVDCGTKGKPPGTESERMLSIAKDVEKRCGGALDAVVATHRHQDHVSGFGGGVKGPGAVFERCKPKVVVQPWTEVPNADLNWTGPGKGIRSAAAKVAALRAMQRFADAAVRETARMSSRIPRSLKAQLAFVGEDNISNVDAVKRLMAMGKAGKAKYVYYGSKSGLEPLLPGVSIRVFGPPTLRQTEAIRDEAEHDDVEFWHLQGLLAAKDFTTDGSGLTNADAYAETPPYARWFCDRLRILRAEQLFELVTALDNAMNNTSVILAFKVKGHVLLFPGDAQIENWRYALSKKSARAWLAKTRLYKVGHHGSLNATPKSLWNLFEHRADGSVKAMQSVNSTMGGKYGKESNQSEVPRRPLVDALEASTRYFTTQTIKGKKLSRAFEVDLTAAGWSVQDVD